ncbi:alkaline phosphatase D family protein [Novosphingobium sp.]|uniref:alkaline phosphatase D family protein n=1 Tax=Novosphingobium sp. TaxID=1874826 RepID=UPI00262F37F7|nr:alkaline phosphatase D family protein [Novosphingobium sp.]
MSFTPTRRSVLAGLTAMGTLFGAPALLRAQQLFTAWPFTLGVAAGDPSPDGFVIWTRLAPDPLAEHGGMPVAPVPVDWEVATDERFRQVVAKGSVIARPELAHAVHVEVAGLQSGRQHFYRFMVGRERSMRGRAKTLPLAGNALDRLRFGVAGCQAYEDGLYTAYRHLANEDVDFIYHYGDYIYENRGSPVRFAYDGNPRPFVRQHVGQEIHSLDDYRRRYAQYKLDADLQAAHASAAWFPTFDDHEVDNNWVQDIAEDGTPPDVFRLRRAMAWQAYYEHLPFRKASFPQAGGMQIHRRAVIGNLVDLHLLDTRQFRSDQPCGDSLKAWCKDIADPKAQVLGEAQEKWLGANLAQKAARWNVVAQQIMMMPLDRKLEGVDGLSRNLDSWGGYDVPRERLFERFKGLRNVVVLTGDEHQNYAGELRTKVGTGDVAAVEFVSTSISSGGDGADHRAGNERIEAANPYLKYTNDRRGYLLCEVTPERWQTSFRTVEKVSVPGVPIKTARVATVEHGSNALAFD